MTPIRGSTNTLLTTSREEGNGSGNETRSNRMRREEEARHPVTSRHETAAAISMEITVQ